MMTARSEWQPRPALSRAIRALALSVPVVAAVAAGWAMGRWLPRPSGIADAAWLVAVLGAATVTLLVVDRVARRVLPLAFLLRLTAVFPDHAPSRLRVAFRSASIARLRQRATADDAVLTPVENVEDLVTLATALTAHDRRTRAHSERVRALTRLVGEQLRLAGPAVERLEWAAFLHDIGKITVPPAILNKPGRPDPEEWSVLAKHPDEGAQLAAPLIPWLGDWLRGVRDHHERWDGTGYPNQLAGPDISLAGRIVGVTDAFETMTAVRSYKRPMSAPAARTELVACSGTHFDPHVVRAFLDVSLGRLCVILGPLSWLALVPLIGRLPRALAATAARGTSGQLGRGLRAVGIAVTAAGAVTSLAVAPPRSGPAATPNAAIAPLSPRTTTTLPAPTIPGPTSPTPPLTPTGTDGIASTVTGVAPVVTVGHDRVALTLTPGRAPLITLDAATIAVSPPPGWVRQAVRARSCGLSDGSRPA
jgi:HD-GYP domain-containing protein (c-di-GMP phosphodiesterase class II)